MTTSPSPLLVASIAISAGAAFWGLCAVLAVRFSEPVTMNVWEMLA